MHFLGNAVIDLAFEIFIAVDKWKDHTLVFSVHD